MSELFRKISRVSWIIMVALLPISSMPLVAKMLGSDSVASPTILFMLVLLVSWFLPRVFRDAHFSNHILPLFIFCLVALIATALSLFYHVPAFKGINQFAPAISSVGTLLIGFFFFVTASSFLENQEDARLTVQVLNWSGLVIPTPTSGSMDCAGAAAMLRRAGVFAGFPVPSRPDAFAAGLAVYSEGIVRTTRRESRR